MQKSVESRKVVACFALAVEFYVFEAHGGSKQARVGSQKESTRSQTSKSPRFSDPRDLGGGGRVI